MNFCIFHNEFLPKPLKLPAFLRIICPGKNKKKDKCSLWKPASKCLSIFTIYLEFDSEGLVRSLTVGLGWLILLSFMTASAELFTSPGCPKEKLTCSEQASSELEETDPFFYSPRRWPTDSSNLTNFLYIASTHDVLKRFFSFILQSS